MRWLMIANSSNPERAKQTLSELGELSEKISVINGFNGITLGLKQKYHDAYLRIPNEVCNPCYVTPGHLSLSLNHMMCWTISEMLDDDELMVLEDDVFLAKDFHEKWPIILDDFRKSDLDALWLEHCCYDKKSPGKVGEYIERTTYNMCSAAILWKKSGYKKALEVFHKTPLATNIDIILLQRVMPHLKCGVCIPQIVFQKTYAGIWEGSLHGH